DGRFVAFQSISTDLLPAPGCEDTLRDRVRNTTTCVATDQGLKPHVLNGLLPDLVVARDGRYVVFSSGAQDLVPGDTVGTPDLFIRSIPVPTVGSTSIASVARGQTFDVTVNGTDFLPGVVGVFPKGVTVNSTNRVSAEQVVFRITVAGDAPTGPQPVYVYDP